MSIRWYPASGGLRAYSRILEHHCNAYCVEGTHADIAYSSNEMTEEYARRLYARHGAEVVRFEPAPEAPPEAPNGATYTYRWLIGWRW